MKLVSISRPKTIDVVASLTIIVAIIALVMGFLWTIPFVLLIEPRTTLDFDILIYVSVRIYEPIFIASAIIVGFYTTRNKIWTRKANIILQAVTILIFLIGSLQFVLTPSSGDSVIREDFLKNISLIFCAITLYLLFRPEVKEHYQRLNVLTSSNR